MGFHPLHNHPRKSFSTGTTISQSWSSISDFPFLLRFNLCINCAVPMAPKSADFSRRRAGLYQPLLLGRVADHPQKSVCLRSLR